MCPKRRVEKNMRSKEREIFYLSLKFSVVVVVAARVAAVAAAAVITAQLPTTQLSKHQDVFGIFFYFSRTNKIEEM